MSKTNNPTSDLIMDNQTTTFNPMTTNATTSGSAMAKTLNKTHILNVSEMMIIKENQ